MPILTRVCEGSHRTEYPKEVSAPCPRGTIVDQAVISTPQGRAVDGAAVRVGEAHALAILDAALDAVVTIDYLGRVLEFNLAAEWTFGYRREDVLGQELAELVVPPEFREAHRRALARWTESGPMPGAGGLLGRRTEVRAMRSDGSTFPAELAICRVDLPGPPLFTACIRDLSEQKNAEERLRAAEFRFRTLVEQLPLISYVDSPDSPLSKPLYLSPQIQSVLGYTPEEWISTPGLFERSIHEDDHERLVAERQAAYERGEALRTEYRMITADGRVIWVEDQSMLVEPPGGGPAFRQGFAIDVTERKQSEDALRLAEGRYRTLVEQLPLAVYIDRIDPLSSSIYISPQIEPMLGYSIGDWISNPSLFVEILHPDDSERVLAATARTHATGEPLHLEYRLIARDERIVWVRDEASVIVDYAGAEPVLQGYLLEVTAEKEAEEQLRYQAFHDPLTSLANRALFTDRVEHAAIVHSAAGDEIAVLYLDLDDFKSVNDTFGHPAADALLRAFGERLVNTLSPRHTIARLGGDEFAILVEERAGATLAVDVAESLIAALDEPFELDGREVFVTASIGIAVGDGAEDLLRAADVAMYGAKASGKAQYVVYAPQMDEDSVGRLQLVADLRRANVDEDFVLHYQPTIELETGTIVGVEALVRWQHPTRGLVPPLDFIPLAEETGRIVEIGRWVLSEACRQTARWRAELPGAASLELSVNVSTRQVRRPALLEDVRSALASSGLPPDALMLEITESVLARRLEEMTSTLDEVISLGVQLALDDFGTGYSSLSLLQTLPVHTLKIDRSFVQSIGTGPERRAFVRAIVDLAEALSLRVVAEGIELEAQVTELWQLGCRLGQGFLFARPLEPKDFEKLILAGPIAPGPEPRLASARRSQRAA
jgi:diguanylate cyclase (GGDEF)-like protein/PAS domain S-box-containing protein